MSFREEFLWLEARHEDAFRQTNAPHVHTHQANTLQVDVCISILVYETYCIYCLVSQTTKEKYFYYFVFTVITIYDFYDCLCLLL